MAEYIEREALKKHLQSYAGMFTDELGFVVSLQAVLDGIDFQPVADAVEVVWCWDCAHCDSENHLCNHPNAPRSRIPRKDNDYCSYGERRAKRTVVFDFDGVIHSYVSGWRGVKVIPDPPVPGIREAIAEIRAAGYEVVVVSTRTADAQGKEAVCAYLTEHGIEVDRVCAEKPPAVVYIDDRAICFDGKPEALLNKVQTFKPWNKKGE